MHVVNPSAATHRVVDGINFLKGFYKLSRLHNQVLLGKLNPDHIHLRVLRPDTSTHEILKAGTSAASTPLNRRKSHWNTTDIEMESKREHKAHVSKSLPPMLPSLCDGGNPWTVHGPRKQSGLNTPSSRSGSRILHPIRERTSRSPSPLSQDHGGRSRSPSPAALSCRSGSSTPVSTPRTPRTPRMNISNHCNSPPEISIAVVSKRPSSAPARTAPFSDKRPISAQKVTDPGTQASIESTSTEIHTRKTADFLVPAGTLKIASRYYGEKLTRTSLPSTFSPVGLARQFEPKRHLSAVKKNLFDGRQIGRL
jgi:hypothetical protein